MRHHRFLRLLVPALIVCSLYAACKKSDFENLEFADHAAEFAFPLFTTTLTLEDLLAGVLNDSLSNDTLLINDDGTMTLFYTGDVAQKPATDIFKFFQGGAFPLSDTVSMSPIQAPDGVIIYKAVLKGGNIAVSIFNTFNDTITGVLHIPQMAKDGVPFAFPFVALPNENFVSPAIPVDGYILTSTDNILQFRYEAYKPSGERVKFLIGGFFPGIYVGFNQLEFSYLEGYWGYSYYPLTRDTIDIDINQTNLDGNVKIKNPRIIMRISNSWGFPTRGVIKYLSFIRQNGEELKLETTAFVNDSIVDFNYPTFPNEIGQTKYTDVYLDETNSNIAEIFNAQPTQFIYEVNGISNALLDPTIIGFMTDSSIIKLSMRVELDLEGSAQNFGAEQTLDLNFGDYSSIDSFDIENVEFKLVTENGTPISTSLQIFFEDEAGNTIDSLFAGAPRFIMQSAPVNAEGVATGSTRTETLIPMSVEQFDRVRLAKRAVLQTAFTTADGGSIPVKLLATNQVTVKMGLKVKTRS